jgi:hypothetical protein
MERREPGGDRQPGRGAAHPLRLELEAGQEEEEGEAELREQVGERRHMDEVERRRPGEDAEDDLDDDERRRGARHEIRHDGRGGREGDDADERREVDLHGGDPLTPPPRTKRGLTPFGASEDRSRPRRLAVSRKGKQIQGFEP